MSAKSNVNIGNVSQIFIKKGRESIINAAGAAIRETTNITPFRKGELRTKRRVIPFEKGAKVQWFARHAAVQNLGRRRGARAFMNYTTPGTGKSFVQAFTGKFIKTFMRYF